MPGPIRIEPITDEHDGSSFSCGKHELDDWLQTEALASEKRRNSRTYIVHANNVVLGYYALAASSVERERAPGRIRRQSPKSIPVILLARMAVDNRAKGQGLGAALLRDALIRAANGAREIGVRAVLVHAKDDEAKEFYLHFNFEESPTDPLHLFLSIQDIEALLAEADGRGGR